MVRSSSCMRPGPARVERAPWLAHRRSPLQRTEPRKRGEKSYRERERSAQKAAPYERERSGTKRRRQSRDVLLLPSTNVRMHGFSAETSTVSFKRGPLTCNKWGINNCIVA